MNDIPAKSQVKAATRLMEAAVRQPRAARIALFGNFGSANFGNEASFDVVLEGLRRRYPAAEFLCVCRNPEALASRMAIETLPLKSRRELSPLLNLIDRAMLRVPSKLADLRVTWRLVSNIDAVLVPGTGILDDFGERPTEMPWELFKWSAIAALRRRPFAFVSVGAGPIRNKLSRWLMVGASKMAGYRSYRDRGSEEFMRAHGVETARDHVGPDVVFAMVAPQGAANRSPPTEPLTVGVGVMSYAGWQGEGQDSGEIYESYLARISKFVGWLLQRGFRVRLMIGSLADRETVEAVLSRVSAVDSQLSESALAAEPQHSQMELMAQMASTDIVVATRFHNVVAALVCGKPVVSLGYAQKNAELLQEFGLEDFHQPVEGFDLERLKRQFDQALSARTALGERILAVSESFRAAAGREERRLADYLAAASKQALRETKASA